jgi:hypothetical protein
MAKGPGVYTIAGKQTQQQHYNVFHNNRLFVCNKKRQFRFVHQHIRHRGMKPAGYPAALISANYNGGM